MELHPSSDVYVSAGCQTGFAPRDIAVAMLLHEVTASKVERTHVRVL